MVNEVTRLPLGEMVEVPVIAEAALIRDVVVIGSG